MMIRSRTPPPKKTEEKKKEEGDAETDGKAAHKAGVCGERIALPVLLTGVVCRDVT